MKSQVENRFEEGIRLFNNGNFFKAHEVWEEEWKRAHGLEKVFYQGLIQAAAALLHAERGNYAGAVSLYLKCCSKLDQFPAKWKGIELGQVRSELSRFFSVLQSPSDVRAGSCQSMQHKQVSDAERSPAIRKSPLQR
jgi:uncharacterized protein